MEERALKHFYRATRRLREAMEGDLLLNDFDRICLENYISLLQMTYIEWKRRMYNSPTQNRELNSDYPRRSVNN
jgi:hypothetical protein